MRKRTVIRRLPDGSTEVTEVSQGCVTATLAWIFWIWLGAFVLVAPAEMGLWSIPIYGLEALMVVAYISKRVSEYRTKQAGSNS